MFVQLLIKTFKKMETKHAIKNQKFITSEEYRRLKNLTSYTPNRCCTIQYEYEWNSKLGLYKKI